MKINIGAVLLGTFFYYVLMSCSMDSPPELPQAKSRSADDLNPNTEETPTPQEGPDGLAENKIPTPGDTRKADIEKIFHAATFSEQSFSWTGDYRISEKTLTFVRNLDALTKTFLQVDRPFVHDSYTQSKDPSGLYHRFKMSREPDITDIRVVINAMTDEEDSVSPTLYHYDKPTRSLVFKDGPPPTGASIIVYYKEHGNLLSSFNLGLKVQNKSIKAFINNRANYNFTYNAASGFITFSEPPPDNASIRISMDVAGAPVLSYSILLPEAAVEIEAFKKNQPIVKMHVAYTEPLVTFIEQEFEEGAIITVRYKIQTGEQILLLEETPVTDSLNIEMGNNACTMDDFSLEENMIKTKNCRPSKDSPVVIKYRRLLEKLQTFTVSELQNAQDYDWTVFVDGIENFDFIRRDNSITFIEELPLKALVKIRLFKK